MCLKASCLLSRSSIRAVGAFDMMDVMKTITTKIKHEIIDLVQSGKLNARDAAVRYGIPESLIQSWAVGSTSPSPRSAPVPQPKSASRLSLIHISEPTRPY